MKVKEKFSGISVEKLLAKYPDPHQYASVRERSFWALHVLPEELNVERIGIAEIANFLTEIVEIDTSPQAVSYALNNAGRGYVNKKNGLYKLMQKGRDIIILTKPDTLKKQNSMEVYINSGTPYSAKSQFVEEVISCLSGDVKICDPYIGVRLLDILAKGDKKNKVQILTNQVEDKPVGIFARALEDLNREGFDITVKVYASSELHDRYIIAPNGMWIVGHSIKDLGKKECFIVQVNDDLRSSLSPVFDRRWSSSQPIK